MEKEALNKRAAELHKLAQTRHVNGLEADLADLPKDDPIAQIGLLASKLDIDFGLAFDTSAQLGKGA